MDDDLEMWGRSLVAVCLGVLLLVILGAAGLIFLAAVL